MKHGDATQPGQQPPRVLLLATGKWISTARLSMSLSALGCEVHLMALRRHPARLTHALHARYPYHPLRPLQSIRSAIANSQPDTVIPADELAVLQLEELYTSHADLRALLERSLGGAEVMVAARSRIALIRLAEAAGIAVPDTLAIDAASALPDAAQRLGLPMVLKSDSTSGGRGVRVVDSVASARSIYHALQRPPSLPRAAWRSIVWKEHTHFRTWALGHQRGITVQRLIQGKERTAMAVAHQGNVLAIVCLEVVETWELRGPSSVLRVIDDPTMEAAVRAVVRTVGLSGFCGCDFMLDSNGTPLLIEMNPRPTQLAHLPLGAGRDLVAAYLRGVLRVEVPDRESVLMGDLIALFPQELQRDPHSPWIAQAYHDVPWSEPALLQSIPVTLPETTTTGLKRR